MAANGELRIKKRGWVPAGEEMRAAFEILSDGAFRLYFYLCVTAQRDRGTVRVRYADLASKLNRSRRSISTYMEELKRKDICSIQHAPNQHEFGELEIHDDYWPYRKLREATPEATPEGYSEQIRRTLGLRACVRCEFSAADRKRAMAYFAAEVPLEQIERGIALGCTRKYVSMLNGSDCNPIVSLAYFAETIAEATDANTPEGYWGYIAYELERMESRWQAVVTGNAKDASAKPKTTTETR